MIVSTDDDLPSENWTLGDSGGEASSVHLFEATPTKPPRLWRDEQDGPMPLRWAPRRVSYPDLVEIDESAWPTVLAPLPSELRMKAACNQYLGVRTWEARDLARALPPSPTDRARAAVREGTHVPVPRARREGWRQMTVRISDDDYEDLAVVAQMLGTRPAQLARMLVLNGVRRALADQDAGR